MRIKQHVTELATKLEMTERWQIEVAAMLSQIGLIALPAETAEKIYYRRALTADEQAMVERVPVVTEQLLGSIPRLEVVRGIIGSVYRTAPLPKSGKTPLQASIVTGAELLRIAVDFDALEADGNTPALALDTMLGRKGRYNAAMLRAFEAIRNVHRGRDEVREVSLSDLTVGMVLAEDVRLHSGTLLAGRGYEVTASFVERARNFRDTVAKTSVRVVIPGGAAA